MIERSIKSVWLKRNKENMNQEMKTLNWLMTLDYAMIERTHSARQNIMDARKYQIMKLMNRKRNVHCIEMEWLEWCFYSLPMVETSWVINSSSVTKDSKKGAVMWSGWKIREKECQHLIIQKMLNESWNECTLNKLFNYKINR